jgi:5'-methylthioadenosine phosphorylase
LRDLGVRAAWSTAAVGGLRSDWPVGTIAVCSDLLDPSGRRLTLHDREVVHTDLTHPFDPDLRSRFLAAAATAGVAVEPRAVYVNGDGPRYESPAEVEALRRLGGDVVGMTAGSEAILMREAGVPYACAAVVTNLASGLAGLLSHEEVVDAMRARGPVVLDLILAALGERCV